MLTTMFLLFAMADETGFVPLFDGKTLKGWQLVAGHGRGYVVEDGAIVCPADGGGNLLTDREYGDFILRLEYKLSAGGNNGIGIRTPLTGDAAYAGMEIQVLDDQHAQYKGKIKPEQHTAAINDVFPARTGLRSLRSTPSGTASSIRGRSRSASGATPSPSSSHPRVR